MDKAIFKSEADEDDIESGFEADDINDELEYITAVDGLKWTSIKFGHPSDNEMLRDWIESFGGVTLDAVENLFDELWDVKMIASSAAIKALQKLNELMDDVEVFNFAELVQYIEEKTPLNMFYGHSQDFTIHLTEMDRMWIEQIPILKSRLGALIVSVDKRLLILTKRIEALETGQTSLNSKLNVHMTDDNAHFQADEKAYLLETAANFDNPMYMRGCEITFDRSVKGIIAETALKGGEIFAERTTDYTDRKNIRVRTVFYLEHGTVGVQKTTSIDEAKNITEKIERIEIEGAG